MEYYVSARNKAYIEAMDKEEKQQIFYATFLTKQQFVLEERIWS